MDKEQLYQEALDHFPVCFHVMGNKKNVGRFILLLMVLTNMTLIVIFAASRMAALLGFLLFGAFIYFIYKALKWEQYVLIYILFGAECLIILFINVLSIVKLPLFGCEIWGLVDILIHRKAEDIAYERLQNLTHAEADHDLKNAIAETFFKDSPVLSEEELAALEEKQTNDPNVDYSVKDKPVWDAAVNVFVPEEFCPKCGFAVVPGESKCSVCGTVFENKQENTNID